MSNLRDEQKEKTRRWMLQTAEKYRARVEMTRAGQFSSWDNRCIRQFGLDFYIDYLERNVAYWTARAMGMPASDEIRPIFPEGDDG